MSCGNIGSATMPRCEPAAAQRDSGVFPFQILLWHHTRLPAPLEPLHSSGGSDPTKQERLRLCGSLFAPA